MENIDATAAFIEQMRALGARAALDDFGTGFSSFYYLKRFDVDYLKISGAFTQDLSDNEESRVFVKAVNDLARNLKRQVIAKGVETELMVKLLKEAGALYAQGHYFQAAAPLGTAIPAPDRKSSRG
jgi:EAL domain-containing protein (putative c-di-GMP-specific phosphodiesterase class I)